MSDSVLPFLMFDGQAEEAMRFYVSLFPESEVIEIARYGKGAPGAEGKISRARFSVGGQTIVCTDSTVKHAFTFTPATSLFVQCKSRERMRVLVEKLSVGGRCSCRSTTTASASCSPGWRTGSACRGS